MSHLKIIHEFKSTPCTNYLQCISWLGKTPSLSGTNQLTQYSSVQAVTHPSDYVGPLTAVYLLYLCPALL